MKNEFSQNELDKNAAGGAELMLKRLHKHIRPDLLENVQIINSRYRGFDPDKKHYLLWEHDLPGDPESVKIFTDSDIMNKLEVYVFVSRWQRNQFVDAFPLLRTPQAYQKTTIIHNAIEPFDLSNRKYMTNGKVNLIYTPTPHRGLEILVPVFIQLAKDFPDILHLDVYSSFNLYGWGERDKPYEHLFKAIEDHQDATYHGSVPNDEIREAYMKADILSYPSIWQENSCLCMIESMSSGCLHVCSDLASLPENCGGMPYLYSYNQDMALHAQQFYSIMHMIIRACLDHPDVMLASTNPIIFATKVYADTMYSTAVMKNLWENLLVQLNRG